MTVAVNAETARLADQLERSFRGGAWHGPAVLESLDGVDAAAAAARPDTAGHSIAELVGHIAFWIDAGRRRLAGDPVSKVSAEENFPLRGADSEEAWKHTLARLEEAHRGLHAAVLAMADEQLDDPVGGSDPTARGMLLGILQHNAYHAGQIVLLKRLPGGAR